MEKDVVFMSSIIVLSYLPHFQERVGYSLSKIVAAIDINV